MDTYILMFSYLKEAQKKLLLSIFSDRSTETLFNEKPIESEDPEQLKPLVGLGFIRVRRFDKELYVALTLRGAEMAAYVSSRLEFFDLALR